MPKLILGVVLGFLALGTGCGHRLPVTVQARSVVSR